MAVGTGGAIAISTISARTRRRLPPSGPWPSAWRRSLEGTAIHGNHQPGQALPACQAPLAWPAVTLSRRSGPATASARGRSALLTRKSQAPGARVAAEAAASGACRSWATPSAWWWRPGFHSISPMPGCTGRCSQVSPKRVPISGSRLRSSTASRASKPRTTSLPQSMPWPSRARPSQTINTALYMLLLRRLPAPSEMPMIATRHPRHALIAIQSGDEFRKQGRRTEAG